MRHGCAPEHASGGSLKFIILFECYDKFYFCAGLRDVQWLFRRLQVVCTFRWEPCNKIRLAVSGAAIAISIRFPLIPRKIAHQFSVPPIGVTEMLRCAKHLKTKGEGVTESWAGL